MLIFPKLIYHVVIFHEYAHQMGYADEAEASFHWIYEIELKVIMQMLDILAISMHF